MKKLILKAAILLTSFNCFSQNILQYSGNYPNGSTIPGKANYSYYLKNDAKIKHGKFTYIGNIKTTEGYYNATFSGNYKDNFKDGLWMFDIDYKDYNTGEGNNYLTGKIKFIANYTNGQPNGIWSYSEVNKRRSKEFSALGYTWSAFNPESNTSVSASFSNGTLVGAFKMNDVLDNEYGNISGLLDNSGFCINEWISRSNSKEQKSYFYKNIEIKSVITDIASGEVIEKTNFTDNEINLIKKFIDGQISAIELEKNRLVVDTVNLLASRIITLNTTFYSPNFLYEFINGDKSYSFDNFQYSDIKKGLYRISVIKIELLKLDEIDLYKSGYLYEQNNPKYALSTFENVLSKYRPNLDEQDLVKLNDKINQIKNVVDSEKSQTNKENQFTQDKYSCENLITKNQEIINASNSKNCMFFEKNLLQKYYEYKEATSDYVKQRDLKDEISNLYNKLSNLNYSVYSEYTSKLNKMTNQNGDVQKLIKTIESSTFDLQKIIDSYNSFILNNYGIKFKYTVYNKEKSDESGQDVMKINKKPVYESWIIVRDKLLSDFDNNKDLSVKNNSVQQLEKISKYVLLLADSDSKDIEKSLKGKTDYNEIVVILNK